MATYVTVTSEQRGVPPRGSIVPCSLTASPPTDRPDRPTKEGRRRSTDEPGAGRRSNMSSARRKRTAPRRNNNDLCEYSGPVYRYTLQSRPICRPIQCVKIGLYRYRLITCYINSVAYRHIGCCFLMFCANRFNLRM